MTAPTRYFFPGDSVRIPRWEPGSHGEYRVVKFSRYGDCPYDRHGFYGYLRRWSETRNQFYYQREESFWELPEDTQ